MRAGQQSNQSLCTCSCSLQADTNREFAGKLGLKTFPTIVMLPKFSSSGVVKYPTERRDTDSLDMWVKTIAGYES